MAIPDYQTIMLPLLKFVSDQKEHNVREMINYLANEFCLSDDEKRRLLPSGNDVMFDNKVKWSRLYLGKAGLLKSTGRGYWRISDSGLQVLSQNPPRIDIKVLEKLPEYQEWKKTFSKETKGKTTEIIKVIEEQTPEEAIEYGYQQMRNELAEQLLIRLSKNLFCQRLIVYYRSSPAL